MTLFELKEQQLDIIDKLKKIRAGEQVESRQEGEDSEARWRDKTLGVPIAVDHMLRLTVTQVVVCI